ncbi:putative RNA-binding Zn ribbon-like protein [Streptomyces phaeochromogenes]|uniref:CGNR zinc finger domain-containing protein n=1 Tax=Streptomyces phaeochromogenes TaxID=1923 RepID=UPI00278D386D|nr:CGNR zinc finger domain-containing protein [Streptomyces phaeochromogenes]MDQ0952473.1 putative RNA-binding Zn ribbon-like protein [Streptomyces phaeochromogenes]
MSVAARDPRPLTGEPLSLDLLNTRWMHDGVAEDLLTDTEGLAVWLAANALDFTADEATLRHALTARDALRAAVDGSLTEGAGRVDAVLAHGRIRATLTTEGPGEEAEFRDPPWGPAWLAARDYLELLNTAPDRIRRCAHEACVLHFFDTSRNGTRRWCSMAACGNRAKASRHYARTREG